MENSKSFRLWWPAEKKMVTSGMLTFDLSDGRWLWEGRSGSFHSSFGTLMEGTGVEISHEGDFIELFEKDIIEVAGTDIVEIIKDEQTGNFTTRPEIKYASWGYSETMVDHRDRIKLLGNSIQNEELLYK